MDVQAARVDSKILNSGPSVCWFPPWCWAPRQKFAEIWAFLRNQHSSKQENFKMKIVYLLGCKKCQTQYVGESNRSLLSRFSEHLGYVKNQQIGKPKGEHFKMKGHQI